MLSELLIIWKKKKTHIEGVLYVINLSKFLLLFFLIILVVTVQSDEDCCNNCEEVREAYRKKGWALSNPDLIDQVCENESLFVDLSNFL